jgi:hypothetical protein
MRSLGIFALCTSLVLAAGIPSRGGRCAASTLSALNLDFMGDGGAQAGLAARPGNPDNAFWNASALGFGSGRSAFAGFMDYLVGVRGGTAGYLDSSRPGLGYGFWVSYLTSGSLTRTGFDDPTGGKAGFFTYTELVAGASAGRLLLPYLAVGGSLKGARQHLGDFATSGLFGDLGLTLKAYSPAPERASRPAVYASYIVRNIQVQRWEERVGDVNTNSEVAVALDFPQSATTAGVSFYFGTRGNREIRCGLESALSDEFDVLLGYRKRIGLLSDQANGFAWHRGLFAGFGVRFGSVWVDYTFEDASPLDNVHRFSLRSALGTSEEN